MIGNPRTRHGEFAHRLPASHPNSHKAVFSSGFVDSEPAVCRIGHKKVGCCHFLVLKCSRHQNRTVWTPACVRWLLLIGLSRTSASKMRFWAGKVQSVTRSEEH